MALSPTRIGDTGGVGQFLLATASASGETLQQPGEHGAHAPGEDQRLLGIASRHQLQGNHKLQSRCHLAAFSACLSVALTLLALAEAIGPFPDQQHRGARRADQLIGEAPVAPRDPVGQPLGQLRQLQRDAVDIEPLVWKLIGVCRSRARRGGVLRLRAVAERGFFKRELS